MFSHPLDERRHLRLFELADAEELFTLIDAERARLAEWLPWAADQTHAATREFIVRGLRQFATNDGFQAAIVDGEAIVGAIGVHGIDWSNRRTSLGYWIAADAEGHGTVTAACVAIVEHAFSRWDLHRIEIGAATDNHRSRAIPTRLGFREEGIIRGTERVGTRNLDHAVYGLLAPEWRARR